MTWDDQGGSSSNGPTLVTSPLNGKWVSSVVSTNSAGCVVLTAYSSPNAHHHPPERPSRKAELHASGRVNDDVRSLTAS